MKSLNRALSADKYFIFKIDKGFTTILGIVGKKEKQFDIGVFSEHSLGPHGSDTEYQGYKKKVSALLSQVQLLLT